MKLYWIGLFLLVQGTWAFADAARAAAIHGADCKPLDVLMAQSPDFRRNRPLVAAHAPCVRNVQIAEANGFVWDLWVVSSGRSRQGPLIVALHDNEEVAFDGALEAVATHGGVLVAVNGANTRWYQGVDPNRAFYRHKGGLACDGVAADGAANLWALIDAHMGARTVIYSAHSNANGHRGNGGSGTISIKRPSDIFQRFDFGRGLFQDEDHVLITIQRSAKDLLQTATDRGFHIMVEDTATQPYNCSLSHFVETYTDYDYANIEVQNGVSGVWAQMFGFAYEALGS